MATQKNIKIIKKGGFWKLTTLLFMLMFAAMALYHFDFNFNQQLNSVFNVDSFVMGVSDLPSNMIERNGKTYIGYDGPKVNLTVIRDPKCENSKSCNVEDFVYVLKRDLTPLITEEVKNFTDEDSRKMIKDLGIKALPAFVFDKNVAETASFKYMKNYFRQKGDKYLLITEASKFLYPPELKEVYKKGIGEVGVNVVWYGNFACKDCKGSMNVMDNLLKDYEGKINVFYKHFAVSGKEIVGEQAVECAGDQGKFFDFYNKLFEKAAEVEFLALNEFKERLPVYAGEVSLDINAFNSCIQTEKYKNKVLAHKDEADAFGIGETPSLFIDDQVFKADVPYENLKKFIDMKLAE
jgi:protein-disulfide isomerase